MNRERERDRNMTGWESEGRIVGSAKDELQKGIGRRRANMQLRVTRLAKH